MKILWKNVWYNLVGRIPSLRSYYKHGLNKSIWRCCYYPHLQPWTKAQEDHLYKEIERAADELVFEPPVFTLKYPRQQAKASRKSSEDKANSKATQDTE